MTLEVWIPAGILSGAATLVSLWLSRRIEHRYDAKLAKLETGFRRNEELLKAELRARENAISMLSSGALSALSARQLALHTKRLAAVEQIWTAVVSLAAARNLSTMMTGIRFAEAVKHSKENASVRKVAEEVLAMSGFIPVVDELRNATLSRPFVSPVVWSTYSAYSAICTVAVVRWTALAHGLGSSALLNNDRTAHLIKTALPHFGEFLDTNGPESFHYVLEELEAKLLRDFEAMLRGAEDDAASVAQAAATVRAAQAVEGQGLAESAHVGEPPQN